MNLMKSTVSLVPLTLGKFLFRRLICWKPVPDRPEFVVGQAYLVEELTTIDNQPWGRLRVITEKDVDGSSLNHLVHLANGSFEPMCHSLDEQAVSKFDWRHVKKTLLEIEHGISGV